MLASPVSNRKLLLALTPEHRKQLTQLLLQTNSPQQNQFHATWCDTGTHARSLIKTQHFDLLLVSEEIAARDGDLIPHLRQAPDCPSIIYIANKYPLNMAELLEQGVHEILPVRDINPTRLAMTFNTAISREKAVRVQVSRAQYDSLTGLLNREQFAQAVESAIQQSSKSQLAFAVMLLNLDGFYALNGNYGIKSGDQLILRTKDRIQSIIGTKAILARIGTDEFAILLEGLHSSLEVTRIANKLLDVVSIPIIIGTESAAVKSSLGIAFYPQAGENADTLLKNATIALETAKRDPDNSYKRFNKQMELQVRGSFMLEKQLRMAITRDELELYYQPRVDLRNGKIVGAEALIRWNHPDRGLLSPDEFIPIAEESDLMIPLGYWILERACKDWQSLREWGFKDIHLAINLSFRQFHDEDLATTVTDIISRYPINPEYVEFELTETTVMHDHRKVSDTMNLIGQSGITFSLDDFGTGYSSFAHIITLPITLIKIDRSFVKGMQENSDHKVIVQSIITLAHSLNMKVVSEGVEGPEQHRSLTELRCDQSQGYYFSKPVPFDVLCTHLAEALDKPFIIE